MENEKRQIEASKKWAEIGRKIDISQARYPEFAQLAERLIQGQEIEITEKIQIFSGQKIGLKEWQNF